MVGYYLEYEELKPITTLRKSTMITLSTNKVRIEQQHFLLRFEFLQQSTIVFLF